MFYFHVIDFLLFLEPLLLIGPQGVGKNMLADRLLELLQVEREYIQLHRDTSVQSLTLSPTLQDGIITWEDSALVSAVRHGKLFKSKYIFMFQIVYICFLV